MLKRSQSGSRARLLRSSSSPRHHHWKARALAYLGALLFLCTVAFLQAKPKFSLATGRDARDHTDSRHRSAAELIADRQQGQNRLGADSEFTVSKGVDDPDKTALERPNLDEVGNSMEMSDVKVSKKVDEQQATNNSFASGLEEYEYEEDEEENLEEEREADAEFETEELENPEYPRDTTVEGFDDMDEYEQSEKDELEEQVELEGRKIGVGVNFGRKRKEEAHLGAHQSEDSLAAVPVNTLERQDGVGNSTGDFKNGINRRFDRRFGTDKDYNGSVRNAVNATKNLQRLGGIKTVPRWAPVEDVGSGSKAGHTSARRSLAQTYKKNAKHEKDGIIWDHLLGVARRGHEFKNAKTPSVARKFKLGAVVKNNWGYLSSSTGERQDSLFKVNSAGGMQIFSSDDEPLDEDLRGRLEEVTAIEDALLLRTEKHSLRHWLLRSWINSSGKKFSKGNTFKNQASYDPLNPANNPLLQDPDTFDSNGLTNSGSAVRKASQKTNIEKITSSQQ